MSENSYEQAIKYFEKLESRYPYGRFAQQAQIDKAYAHYKAGEKAQAHRFHAGIDDYVIAMDAFAFQPVQH